MSNLNSLKAATANFQAQSKLVTGRRPQKQNNFGIPNFIDKYVPTEGTQADAIRIIRSNFDSPYIPEDFEYVCSKDGVIEEVLGSGVTFDRATQLIELPSIQTIFYMWTKHYNATTKNTVICSGGPLRRYRQLRQSCPHCDEYQDGTIWENGKKVQEASVSRQDQYSFVIVHYKKHHKVPQTDASGAVLKNKRGEPYMTWEPCKGRSCVHCLSNAETVDFRIKHWDLNFTNYNEIVDGFCTTVGTMCGQCNARNNGPNQVLRWEAFTCPICGHVFFDESTTMSDDDIQAVTKNLMLCPNAHMHPEMPKVLPTEHLICDACNSSSQRADICDVDLYVRRTETGENKFTLNLDGFSNVSAIDPLVLEEVAKFDLPKYFMPTPPDEQRQRMARRSGPAARSYAK